MGWQIPYDHEAYWPVMVKTCLDIRTRQEEAFRSLGEMQVGREEKSWRAKAGERIVRPDTSPHEVKPPPEPAVGDVDVSTEKADNQVDGANAVSETQAEPAVSA